MTLEHPEPEDNSRCHCTVVGEIQRADGGDSGEELLDYSSSRRPQLARPQETHMEGEGEWEKNNNNNISTGTNPNHLKLRAGGIVPVSHTAADCFQCPHVESVSVAYFKGKTAFSTTTRQARWKSGKEPADSVWKREVKVGG